MTRDTGVALGLMALAGLYWLGADQIRVSRLEGIVGAQAVPKGLALTLLILSVLLVVQDLWRARQATATGRGGEEGPAGLRAHGRALGMLLIGVGYLTVVTTLGYVPSIALLMMAAALYMGRPWSLGLVAIGVGGAVFYYLVFVRLLGIPLPAGIWPGVWRALAG